MSSPNRRYFENLVYRTLYPTPDHRDPGSFDDFVRKYLIKEVRMENVRYYGREEDRGEQQDALYPGHDYFSTASRLRLSQFPYHRRLFEAFDDLRLTRHDIDLLCIWEGSKAARERFEIENGIKLLDLSWNELPSPPRRVLPTVIHHRIPNRPKRVRPQKKATSVSKSRKRDYYEDQDIWGDFNTSPTVPLRHGNTTLRPESAPSGRGNTTLQPEPISTPTEINNPRMSETSRPPIWDQLEDLMSFVRRAGTHGVQVPAGSSWSTRDLLSRHPPVVVPALDPTIDPTLEHQHLVLDDNNTLPHSFGPPTPGPISQRAVPFLHYSELDFQEEGDYAFTSYDGAPSPRATHRYHTRLANATSEALARTFGH